MKPIKKSGVSHLLDYLGQHKGPQSKSELKKEKDLLFKEYKAGNISLKDYQKKLEELVLK